MDFKFFVAVFILLISFNSVYAENLTIQEQASLCLNESKIIFNELSDENFSIVRVGDIFNESSQIYLAQSSLLLTTNKANFDFVLKGCEEISRIKQQAYESRDLYNTLIKFYRDTISQDLNSSSIDQSIVEIESEIKSERYEKVPELVESTYEQISVFKSENTRLKLVYKNTFTGIKGFFVNNWKILVSLLVILTILYFSFRKSIHRYLIKRKIEKLNLRKRLLKELIKKAQLDYFQTGTISQSVFDIKTNNFAQLVRDIDRQIPLLNEELMRLSSRKTKNGAL